MKTGGTSLRRELAAAAGADGLYPSDGDLAERDKGSYPGPRELARHVRDGRDGGARVLIGHLPYVFVDELEQRPLTATLLRDPVARTISMMEHRRRKSPELGDATYEELLELDGFVQRQLANYQTKVFAFDSLDECPEHVNVPLAIDTSRFERALARLEAVDVLGLTEDYPAFARALTRQAELDVAGERQANRGRYGRPEVSDAVRERILELTTLDRVLYRRAQELVARQSTPLRRIARRLVDLLPVQP